MTAAAGEPGAYEPRYFPEAYPEVFRGVRQGDLFKCEGCGEPVLLEPRTALSMHIDGSSNRACWDVLMQRVLEGMLAVE